MTEIEDAIEEALFGQRRAGIQLSLEGEEFMLARGIQKESLSR